MKRYKVLVDIREKENPYSGEIETKEIEVEAENEYNASKLALKKPIFQIQKSGGN